MEKHLDILFPPNYSAISALKESIAADKDALKNRSRIKMNFLRFLKAARMLLIDILGFANWFVKRSFKKLYRHLVEKNSPLLALKNTRLSVFTLVLIPVLSVMLWGCTANHKEVIRPVEVQTVEKTTGEIKKTFSGTINADVISELAFQVEGEILDLYVKAGDKVKKGQILGRIDNALYRIQMKQAQAQLENAQIQFKNSKNHFSRIDMLHNEGGISDSQWDDARTQMLLSEKEIQIAKEQLDYAIKRNDYSLIKALANGRILKKNASVGDYGKTGQAIYLFQPDAETEFEVYVPQDYVDLLSVGQGAIVTVTPTGDTIFSAKIKYIEQSNYGELPFIVKLVFNSDYPQLKNGMSGLATFNLKRAEPEIRIPMTAVFEDGGSQYVWVVEDVKDGIGKAKKRNIKTGKLDSDTIPVTLGLSDGETIIIKGASEVQEGQKVKIAN